MADFGQTAGQWAPLIMQMMHERQSQGRDRSAAALQQMHLRLQEVGSGADPKVIQGIYSDTEKELHASGDPAWSHFLFSRAPSAPPPTPGVSTTTPPVPTSPPSGMTGSELPTISTAGPIAQQPLPPVPAPGGDIIVPPPVFGEEKLRDRFRDNPNFLNQISSNPMLGPRFLDATVNDASKNPIFSALMEREAVHTMNAGQYPTTLREYAQRSNFRLREGVSQEVLDRPMPFAKGTLLPDYGAADKQLQNYIYHPQDLSGLQTQFNDRLKLAIAGLRDKRNEIDKAAVNAPDRTRDLVTEYNKQIQKARQDIAESSQRVRNAGGDPDTAALDQFSPINEPELVKINAAGRTKQSYEDFKYRSAVTRLHLAIDTNHYMHLRYGLSEERANRILQNIDERVSPGDRLTLKYWNDPAIQGLPDGNKTKETLRAKATAIISRIAGPIDAIPDEPNKAVRAREVKRYNAAKDYEGRVAGDKAVLADPNATDQQKQKARALLDSDRARLKELYGEWDALHPGLRKPGETILPPKDPAQKRTWTDMMQDLFHIHRRGQGTTPTPAPTTPPPAGTRQQAPPPGPAPGVTHTGRGGTISFSAAKRKYPNVPDAVLRQQLKRQYPDLEIVP
jgi:hypothetical protein